jgi:hypothetical protein
VRGALRGRSGLLRLLRARHGPFCARRSAAAHPGAPRSRSGLG